MNVNTNLRKIALLAGAALLSTSAMALPFADGSVTRTETVKYSVPGAATAEGAAGLYEKLRAAATRVCAAADEVYSAYETADSFEACVSAALEKAVKDVAIPMVTALHVQASGGSRLSTVARR